MAKNKSTRAVTKYPTPLSQRSGSKVGWMTYATRREAEVCAKVAMAEARKRAEEGYDFGYCSPGHITRVDDGWEVCIP